MIRITFAHQQLAAMTREPTEIGIRRVVEPMHEIELLELRARELNVFIRDPRYVPIAHVIGKVVRESELARRILVIDDGCSERY